MLTILLVLAGWRILVLGDGTTFFYDEWDFLLDRSTPSFSSWFSDHNGHLSTVPVVVYQVFLQVFGAGTYLPYRALAMLLHCSIAFMVALIVRRHGSSTVSLSAASVVALMGTGWQNWLWGFQIGMELSVVAGLVAIYLIGGHETKRSQWLVIVLLLVAVTSSGVGIPVLLGTFAMSWCRRRKLVVSASLLLAASYGLWSFLLGHTQLLFSNLGLVPSYMARSAAATVSGVGATDQAIGGVLAGVLAAILVKRARSLWEEIPEVPAMVIVLTTGWLLSAASRAQFNEPGASRYVHVGVSLVVPIFALLLTQAPKGTLTSVILVSATVFSVSNSWDVATSAGREFRERSAIVRGEITAVLQISDQVSMNYQPDKTRAPQITFQRLKKFAGSFDLPLLNPREIESAPEIVRREMDRVYLESSDVRLLDRERPKDWNCRVNVSGDTIKVAPGKSVWISAVDRVDVRRLASTPHSLSPSSSNSSLLRFGNDTYPEFWLVDLVAEQDMEICFPRE